MKRAVMFSGSVVIAIITSIVGYGWFVPGPGFNISLKGTFINVVFVGFWVLLVNYIDSAINKKS